MTFENKNLRCNHCRFWWPTGEATGNEPSRQRSFFGQCRRHAPLPGTVDLPDHGRHYPAWATTKRDDWCGEHEHTQQG
jgi:hypothetical protein